MRLAKEFGAMVTFQSRALSIQAEVASGEPAHAGLEPNQQYAATPRKQQQRSSRTRGQLLAAAETVFVRDGYEKAALADIAKTAGKTRGAIYSHFRDKEEIFLTLVRGHASRQGTVFADLLAGLNKSRGVSSLLRDQVAQLANDPSSLILFIEFQLYAVRYPHVRNQLNIASYPAPSAHGTKAWSGLSAGTTFIKETAAVFAALAVLEALQSAIRSASLRWDQESVEAMAEELLKPIFQSLFDPKPLPAGV